MRKAGYSSVIEEVVDRLFVYGTLRSRQPARALIHDHVVAFEPATTTGTLVGFEHYPGLLPTGDTIVIGEIVQLTGLGAAFALLDAYEGSDFLRILKKVQRQTHEEVWTWCYVLADPTLAGHGEPIASGDWVAWSAGR